MSFSSLEALIAGFCGRGAARPGPGKSTSRRLNPPQTPNLAPSCKLCKRKLYLAHFQQGSFRYPQAKAPINPNRALVEVGVQDKEWHHFFEVGCLPRKSQVAPVEPRKCMRRSTPNYRYQADVNVSGRILGNTYQPSPRLHCHEAEGIFASKRQLSLPWLKVLKAQLSSLVTVIAFRCF